MCEHVQVHIGYGTLLLNIAVHMREVGEDAVGGAAVVRAAVSGGAEFLHTGLSFSFFPAVSPQAPPSLTRSLSYISLCRTSLLILRPHTLGDANGRGASWCVGVQTRLVLAGTKMQCTV